VRLAFVDLETTGGNPLVDRVTEVGVVLVDENGVHEWSQLVNPQTRIPAFIERLTGITNDMVLEAPRFEGIAEDLNLLLEDYLFIAHNARFDYGFLKNEFKRLDIVFRPNILCSVKLSRALFPEHKHHNLDSLIVRHDLKVSERHRALGDAQLIHQFWQDIHKTFDADLIAATVKKLVGRSSTPSQIDDSLIQSLPDTPGVYLFYGENDLPLYVGKSTHIKQRVLSHFSADHRYSKEMSLSQQLRRIDYIETAGEIGALLKEAQLIKTLQPIHNRRLRRSNDLCAWQLQQKTDCLYPVLTWADDLDFGGQDNLYGLFRTQRDAHKTLRKLAQDNSLCLGALGLEKVSKGRPCFARQLHKCQGVCVGEESMLSHALRLQQAMTKLKVSQWPYDGAIGLKELDDLHIIDHWCYLGTVRTETEIASLLDSARPTFDKDTYMILNKALKSRPEVIHINRHQLASPSLGC
jgi:DNA polymerase-3 subunit epsilon